MSEYTPALEVVQVFLEAYNVRDLDKFIGQLAPDMLWEDDANPPLNGAEAVRSKYQALFSRDSGQKSTLLARMVFDAYVIDKEYITGRPNSPFTVVTVYKVENEKISYIWTMREQSYQA